MLRALMIAALLATGFALAAKPLQAQSTPCTSRTTVIKQLSKEYSEAPVGMGLANNGGIIELLHSRDRTTWTLIITMPNGMTCPIAAGESWENVPVLVGSKI
ncbi:MAG: hypothetical protein R3229_05765 [Alphaproteobacteria bacterium]|nr:hypothetical protein [Alphaproteobacteria bacterium]